MKKVLFITNIPSPYRVDMYNSMQKLAQKNNFDFEVLFLRIIEDDRNWQVDTDKFKFKYYIDKGFYHFFASRGVHFHFNLAIIKKALKTDKDTHIILSGSWNFLTITILFLLKRFNILKNKTHFWGEANYMYSVVSQELFIYKFINKIRSFIINSIDGKIICPGEISKKTYLEYWNINKEFILFPNLINEKRFIFTPRIPKEKLHFLIVARLDEKTKGILNLLLNIEKELYKKIVINIAGSGEDKEKIENFLKVNNINSVNLLGNCSQENMKKLYQDNDIFLLPSLKDPNPLSVIEAAFSGMPLVISNRCGNYPEIVETKGENKNGFVYDPINKIEINKIINQLLDMDNQELSNLGKHSSIIAKNRFSTTKSILDLISKL